ncbi:MAG: hypothetical protein ACRD1C_08580 [Terriglobales bacterium]
MHKARPGTALLIALTPCIWPQGTTAPKPFLDRCHGEEFARGVSTVSGFSFCYDGRQGAAQTRFCFSKVDPTLCPCREAPG